MNSNYIKFVTKLMRLLSTAIILIGTAYIIFICSLHVYYNCNI